MSSIGPIGDGPFQIARAYQLAGARAPAPAPAAVAPPAGGNAERSAGIARLVAGMVPGRISFAAEMPAQNTSAIAMYRHPADRLAAATAVHAGRVLDTTA